MRRLLGALPIRRRLQSEFSNFDQESDEAAERARIQTSTTEREKEPISMKTPYQERQWRTVDPPPEVFAVPSMLGSDERKLCFSLARDTFRGAGTIVDAGAFLGGSTMAFARGLLARPEKPRQFVLHSFDNFLLDAYSIKHYIDPTRDGPRTIGDSCYDIFTRNIASVAPLVTLHHGDIRKVGWDGRPIEILFLDIIKGKDTNDTVLRDFFTALIPEQSALIQQDYVHEAHFWIHITMEYLHEYFTFIEFVEYSSAVYLLRKSIPREELEGCMWNALTISDKLRLMDNAVRRWQGYPRGVIECARALLEADLGDHESALKSLDRITAEYAWSDHVLTRAQWNRELVLGKAPGYLL
jgi:hypothetical protein